MRQEKPKEPNKAPNIIELNWTCPQCKETLQTVQIKGQFIIWHCPTCKYHRKVKPTNKAGKAITKKIARKMRREEKPA